MKRRVLILGSCLLLAACSTAGSKTVVGAGGKTTPPTASSSQAGQPVPPTLPPTAQGWHRDTGITDGGQVAGHDHACQNSYGNPYRGGWITICAGGKQNLSSGTPTYIQGGIWVNVNSDPRAQGPANDQPPSSTSQEYDTPNAPTWVKIVTVTGDIVTLQREDGTTITFNLQTRQYI
jgi:hypothetical protein